MSKQSQQEQAEPDSRQHSIPSAEAALLAGDSVLNLFRLFKTEVKLASLQIPVLATLWLLKLQMFILLYLGGSCFIGWLVATLAGSAGYGIASFCLLQLAIIFLINQSLRRCTDKISLPETTEQTRQFVKLFDCPARETAAGKRAGEA